MENKKSSLLKKFLLTMGVFIVALFIALQSAQGYASSYQGANKVDSWGYFYFKINGPSTTNLQIRISRSSSPGWATYRDKATTWTATIYSGTNNHNVRFSNGSKSISVTTKLDIDGHYYIYNLPIVYDMPAHYQYTGWGSDRPSITARLNFEEYHPVNDMPNTAANSGYHSTSTTSRSINLQINGAQCGIKTYSKYFYNSTIYLNIGKANHYLDLNGLLDGADNGGIAGYGTADVYINGQLVANDVTDFYQQVTDNSSYQITDIKSAAGKSYNGVAEGSLSGTVCGGNKAVKLNFSTNYYYLDLNGVLDGTWNGGIAGYGTADVYVNGSLVANDVTDFYQSYPYDTSYEIKDIKSTTGHTYNGVNSGQLTGTITGYTGVDLKFSTSSYTNSIAHWAGGFVNGEGNNGGKNMFNFASTSFTALYNSTYTMNASRQATLPKGFYLNSTFGTSSISGAWGSYAQGTNVTQKPNGMGYEYYYSPYTYQISYNLNGGTNASGNPANYNILYGVTLQNPTKTGYTFTGWTDSTGKKVTGINQGANATFSSPTDMYNKLNTRQIGNVSLTANWTPISYSISYNLNGGTVTGNPTTYNIETNSFTLKNPAKNGYTFTGWTGSNGSTPQTIVTIAKGSTGNKSYTANWRANTYTVTYNANGGTGGPTTQSFVFNSGSKLSTSIPTRTGYSFVSWNTATNGTGTSFAKGATIPNGWGSFTLYAQWKANNYTATFNGNGGTTPSPTSITKAFGTALGTLPTTTRTGYNFAGWFTSASGGSQISTATTMPAGNITYYAHWTPVTYSITYNLNGGSVTGNPTTYNIETNTFTLKNPTRNGYTFTGWTGSNGSAPQTTVTITKGSIGNKSYTANWRANTYTITYNLNGGSVTGNPTTYNIETTTFTLKNPTRTGYTFTGWTGSNGSTPQTTVSIAKGSTGNKSYTANWRANIYYVKYNGNGNTAGTTATSTHTYDVSKNLTANGFNKTGYSFSKWTTLANGIGTSYTNSVSVKNLSATNGATVNLYAQWTPNTYVYNIVYKSTSGKALGTSTVSGTFNTSKSVVPINITGYTTPASQTVTWDSVTAKTITFVYTPISYNITINNNGGTGVANRTYNIETPTFTIGSPTRIGYTFTGWTGSNGTTPNKTITIAQGTIGNKSYTANWSINSYTLTFNANGGTVSPGSKVLNYNSPYGTLPTPTRTGFTFVGWFTSASGGSQVSASTTIGASNVTIYAHWTNYTPEFSGPDISKGDKNPIMPFMDNGYLIIQKNDTFTPALYMSVSDKEDGVITGQIKITNSVPLTNGKATVSGTYNVIYKITDKGGASATYTLKVIVNEPPVINPTDRTFFINQFKVTSQELLRKASSSDKEDGVITSKLKIVSIDYGNRIDNNVTELDTTKEGVYTITYSVTDKYKKTTLKSSKITIKVNTAYENQKTMSVIRFIDDSIQTINSRYNLSEILDSDSIWNTNPVMKNKLTESFNNETPDVYEYSHEEIKDIKRSYSEKQKSTETNVDFARKYLK